jgi:hypothetical protein
MQSLLEGLIGDWGTVALRFYLANSQWINLLVLAYGAWIGLSWVNLKRIRRQIIAALAEQIRGQTGSADPQAIDIPWEAALRPASRFPFIAQQSDLLPRRLTLPAVQSMLPAGGLIEAAQQHNRSKTPAEPPRQ